MLFDLYHAFIHFDLVVVERSSMMTMKKFQNIKSKKFVEDGLCHGIDSNFRSIDQQWWLSARFMMHRFWSLIFENEIGDFLMILARSIQQPFRRLNIDWCLRWITPSNIDCMSKVFFFFQEKSNWIWLFVVWRMKEMEISMKNMIWMNKIVIGSLLTINFVMKNVGDLMYPYTCLEDGCV